MDFPDAMATFLFWNIARKPLNESIVRLVERHQIDVLMLAECPMTAEQLLTALNENGGGWQFAAPVAVAAKTVIQIYVRSSRDRIEERFAFPRSTIRQLNWPGLPSLLLGVVHLPSKLHSDANNQFAECAELAGQIRDAEELMGHSHTLVVGDFNVNPFEPGMLDAKALNGESSRRIAEKDSRVVDGRVYPFFYNPMWNFLGDANLRRDGTVGPGGTYFHRTSRRTRISWNIFDQVLVRPDLLPYFKTEELEILTGDGARSFLNDNGTPSLGEGSDHLPLLFKLNL